MKCNAVRDELYAFCDGELNLTLRELIDQHVSQCATCHAELAEIVHMKQLLAAGKANEPSPNAKAAYGKAILRVVLRTHAVMDDRFDCPRPAVDVWQEAEADPIYAAWERIREAEGFFATLSDTIHGTLPLMPGRRSSSASNGEVSLPKQMFLRME
jgi:hypothetical protein